MSPSELYDAKLHIHTEGKGLRIVIFITITNTVFEKTDGQMCGRACTNLSIARQNSIHERKCTHYIIKKSCGLGDRHHNRRLSCLIIALDGKINPWMILPEYSFERDYLGYIRKKSKWKLRTCHL